MLLAFLTGWARCKGKKIMPFEKGNTLGKLNKGRKPSPKAIEASVSARKGKQLSEKHREKIKNSLTGRKITWGDKLSEAKKGKLQPQTTGIKHINWKGDSVKYGALHAWVRRWKGKASYCEKCGTENAKRYEWANIDHKYRRILDDYIAMCPSCHKKYDFNLKPNEEPIA